MIEDRTKVQPGVTLYARYHGEIHTCEVVDVDGETRFRLADGKVYKGPTAAANAISAGHPNGWHWWSLTMPEEKPKAERKPRAASRRIPRAVKMITRLYADGAPIESRWWCSSCMEAFDSEGEPEACPHGHEAVANDEAFLDL